MVPDREVLAPGFAKAAVRDFRTARDFVLWINRALDRSPARRSAGGR